MSVAASLAVRSFAADAVASLGKYLMVLLGVVDVLRSQGHKVASNELRRSLERSIHALRVLADELATIAVIENFVTRSKRCRRRCRKRLQ